MDEEDPKVIKELIDLIKKLGGIEQLEKQFGSFDNVKSSEQTPTVAPLISKKLYEKVLNSATGRSFLPQSRYSFSTNRNTSNSNTGTNRYSSVIRRPGSQTDGIDKISDSTSAVVTGNERPKYVTINRQSANRQPSSTEDENYAAEEGNEENVPVAINSRGSSSNTRGSTNQPQYVSINRKRPSTTESSAEEESVLDDGDDEETTTKLYNFLDRKRRPENEKPSAIGGIR